MLALLHLSLEWQKKPLSVSDVALASNQVRIEFRHADYPLANLRLAIAELDGLLVARVEDPGWLSRLTPGETRTLDRAITGLYKLAGVDVVGEPLAVLPAEALRTAIQDAPVLRMVPDAAALDATNGSAGWHSAALPFRRVPLTWAQWVDWWRRDRAGEPLASAVRVLPESNNGSDGAGGKLPISQGEPAV